MLAQVLSRLGYIYTLSVLPLLLPGLSQAGPIVAPEEYHSSPGARGVFYSSRLVQADGLDVQHRLGQFLSTLNLTARMEPPEHMLELYNRSATAMPSTNIVRSFKNEDSSPYSATVAGVRIHPLLFNISIPRREHIAAAELRLYALVQRDRRRYAGLERKVTVYKIHEGGLRRGQEGGGAGGTRGNGDEARREMEELAVRHVAAKDDARVSFDLSRVVRLWRKARFTAHRLEVHIAGVAPEHGQTAARGVTEDDGRVAGALEGGGSEAKQKAVIIVFSDDEGRPGDGQELNQMIGHEYDLPAVPERRSEPLWGDDVRNGAEPHDQETDRRFLAQLHSNLIYEVPRRIRRNVKDEPCKRSPLYIEFKDIGWDSWVIQPLGYNAYECVGVCSSPMTSEVSPTKHAIVQTLLSINNPQKVSRACCVPTKLDPISLLYEEGGVVTYKHKYEGMVVAECGCR